MKSSKFSDAWKAIILKQAADGMPVADLYRKAGIRLATYFSWKKRYECMLPTDMRRMKLLEAEQDQKTIRAMVFPTMEREAAQAGG